MNNKRTLIDRILANSQKEINMNKLFTIISDHKLIIADIDVLNCTKTSRFNYKNIRRYDITKLDEELEILSNSKEIYKDPNKIYNDILSLFEKCSSDKIIKFKKNPKPWFNENIAKLIIKV